MTRRDFHFHQLRIEDERIERESEDDYDEDTQPEEFPGKIDNLKPTPWEATVIEILPRVRRN